MPRHADRKQLTHDLADAFGLRYRQAQDALNRHRPPTEEEIEAASRVPFDPLLYAATATGRIPSQLVGLGMTVDDPDLYPLRVADPVQVGGGPGPDAVLGMTCRVSGFGSARWPALVVEIHGVHGGGHRPPGMWAAALDILLHDHGFEYNPHTWLPGWRIDLYPVTGEPSARARVHVHHPKGLTLFDGPLALPPMWLASTGRHPLGVTVVAGPTSGTLVPDDLSLGHDGLMEDLFATGDLVAAVIPVHITPVDIGPDQLAARQRQEGPADTARTR